MVVLDCCNKTIKDIFQFIVLLLRTVDKDFYTQLNLDLISEKKEWMRHAKNWLYCSLPIDMFCKCFTFTNTYSIRYIFNIFLYKILWHLSHTEDKYFPTLLPIERKIEIILFLKFYIYGTVPCHTFHNDSILLVSKPVLSIP